MALRFLNSGYFAGRVGIGTETPSEMLEVSGGHIKITNSGNTNLYINANNSGSKATIFFEELDSVKAKIEHNAPNNSMLFTDGSFTDTMTLKGANVGIGTTTPNAKLDVQGTQGQLFSVTDDLSGEIFAVADISGVPIMTVNSSGVSYFDGNVGIGTSTPLAKLEVNVASGDGILIKSADVATLKFKGSGGVSNWGFASTYLTAGDFGLYESNSVGGDPISAGTSRIIVKPGGNVGIGDVTPATKLQISTNSLTNNVAVQIGDGWVGNSAYHKEGGLLLISGTSQDATQTGAGFALQTRNNTNTNYWKSSVIMDRDGAMRFTLGGAGTVAGSEDLTILSNGRVGIGNTNPVAKLHIDKANANSSVIISRSGSNLSTSTGLGSITFPAEYNSSYTDYAAIQAYSNNLSAVRGSLDLKVKSTSGNLLTGLTVYGTSSGVNVGIGTTNPQATLHVKNTVGSWPFIVETPYDRVGKLISTDAGAELIIQDSGSTDNGNSISVSGDTMTLRTANSNRIRILANGNVGINNTSPDFKLDVGGTLGVSDLPGNSTSVSALVADEITGVELVTNGDFSNGQTGWSFQTGWAVSNGGATVSTAGVTSRVAQTLSYVANISTTTKFRYKFEITNITAGSLRLFVNKPTFTEIANVNAVGKYEYDVEVNTGSNGIFYLYSTSSSGNTFQGTVTNVSVKEITPVSNQIQKRELSSDAFGPGNGPYLPLTAGSSYPLTGELNVDDRVVIENTTNLTTGVADSLLIKNLSSGAAITNGFGTAIAFYLENTVYSAVNEVAKITVIETDRVAIDEKMVFSVKDNNILADRLTLNGSGGIFPGKLSVGHTSDASNPLDVRGTGTLGRFQSSNQYVDVLFINNGSTNYLGFNNASFQVYLNGGSGGNIVLNITETAANFRDDVIVKTALLSNQENTDIDTGAEVVAQVAHATYTAAFFDFVVKKGTNVRSGTVYACHDGDTTPLVEFTETSTQDLGDTSDVVLSVDISGTQMRLLATVASDDWSVKSLIRAI